MLHRTLLDKFTRDSMDRYYDRIQKLASSLIDPNHQSSQEVLEAFSSIDTDGSGRYMLKYLIINTPIYFDNSTVLEEDIFPSGNPCYAFHIDGRSPEPLGRIRQIQIEAHKARAGEIERKYTTARHHTPVRIISWLISTPSKVSLLSDMTVDEIELQGGIYFGNIDASKIISGYDPSGVTEFIDSSELFRIAADTIAFSPSFLKKFLSKGTLPLMGMAVIPGNVFFKK